MENNEENIIENTDIANEEKNENLETEKNTIRHIVLSGGGVAGVSFYGTLRESNKKGFWDIKNIKTIYGTSVGSIFGVLLALNFDWDTLDDYIIKRPWQNVYKFNINNIFSIFQTKGIFDIKIIQETFSPLFKAKDLSLDITMKEFYEVTNIEIHIFATDLNTFDSIDFSYKTHPDWKIIDAIYCSCSLPIVFQPIVNKDICFSDGAFLNNYPVNHCINNGAEPREIFGIRRRNVKDVKTNINDESTLFDYITFVLYKTIEKVFNENKNIALENEIFVESPHISITNILNTASSMEERIRLIQIGVDAFYDSKILF